jgi:hypothetical protein
MESIPAPFLYSQGRREPQAFTAIASYRNMGEFDSDCHPLHLPPRIADFGLAFCRRCPIFQAMLRPSAMYA